MGGRGIEIAEGRVHNGLLRSGGGGTQAASRWDSAACGAQLMIAQQGI